MRFYFQVVCSSSKTGSTIGSTIRLGRHSCKQSNCIDVSHLGPITGPKNSPATAGSSPNICAIDYSPVRRYSSEKRLLKIPIRSTAAPVAGLFANASGAGRTLVLFLLAPALIGIVTGSCVSAATTVVERWALGQLAALPDVLPIVGAPLALVVTLGVVVYVTRVATPSTSELYIVT